jgi:hypothetical protein
VRHEEGTPAPYASPDPELQEQLVWRDPYRLMELDVELLALNESSFMLLPEHWEPEKFSKDRKQGLLSQGNWDNKVTTQACYRACVACEKLGKEHPQLLRYLRREPWTGFPVFAIPSGPHIFQNLKKLQIDNVSG